MTHLTAMLRQGHATDDDDDKEHLRQVTATVISGRHTGTGLASLRRIKRRAVIAAESQSPGFTTHMTLFLWLSWQRAPARQGSSS